MRLFRFFFLVYSVLGLIAVHDADSVADDSITHAQKDAAGDEDSTWDDSDDSDSDDDSDSPRSVAKPAAVAPAKATPAVHAAPARPAPMARATPVAQKAPVAEVHRTKTKKVMLDSSGIESDLKKAWKPDTSKIKCKADCQRKKLEKVIANVALETKLMGGALREDAIKLMKDLTKKMVSEFSAHLTAGAEKKADKNAYTAVLQGVTLAFREAENVLKKHAAEQAKKVVRLKGAEELASKKAAELLGKWMTEEVKTDLQNKAYEVALAAAKKTARASAVAEAKKEVLPLVKSIAVQVAQETIKTESLKIQQEWESRAEKQMQELMNAKTAFYRERMATLKQKVIKNIDSKAKAKIWAILEKKAYSAADLATRSVAARKVAGRLTPIFVEHTITFMSKAVADTADELRKQHDKASKSAIEKDMSKNVFAKTKTVDFSLRGKK